MLTAPMVASAGQFLSGVGSVASAFGLGNRDKGLDVGAIMAQNDISFRHQRDAERLLREQEFNQKMDLAKQHGIHPLSVLGANVSTASAPVVHSGSTGGGRSSGADLASIGYGVEQMGRALVRPDPLDPYEAERRELDLRILRAQAKQAEWTALGTEFSVADHAMGNLLGQPGNPPGVRRSNDVNWAERAVAEQSGLPADFMSTGNIEVKQSVLPPHPLKLGHGAATDQAHITVMDSKGNPTSVLNQNAVQAEFNDGATMTWLTNTFGLERAMQIMALLEQAPTIGGALGAAGAAAYWLAKRHPAVRAASAIGGALGLKRKRTESVMKHYRDRRGRFTKKGGK